MSVSQFRSSTNVNANSVDSGWRLVITKPLLLSAAFACHLLCNVCGHMRKKNENKIIIWKNFVILKRQKVMKKISEIQNINEKLKDKTGQEKQLIVHELCLVVVVIIIDSSLKLFICDYMFLVFCFKFLFLFFFLIFFITCLSIFS